MRENNVEMKALYHDACITLFINHTDIKYNNYHLMFYTAKN